MGTNNVGDAAFTFGVSSAIVGQWVSDATGGAEDTSEFSVEASVKAALSINDVALPEGNSGTTAFNFTVTLGAPATGPVTVKYQTSNGTATAPSDYIARGLSTLTFAAGETSKTITVSVMGDTAVEPDENFFVNLSAAVGAVITDGQGTGTIKNDDPDLKINDVRVVEGNSGAAHGYLHGESHIRQQQ